MFRTDRSYWLIEIHVVLLIGEITGSAAGPTVAEAQAFMDRAEAELLKLSIIDQRGQWVHENFITDDTELIAAAQDEKVIGRTTELVKEGRKYESLNLSPALKR